MPRYFIEVSYKGTAYAGFQIQQNANTIQAEIEKALAIFFRRPFSLTGSSRTDAGVHATQNFFHFDTDDIADTAKAVYHLNAILPADIAARSINKVQDTAHCRFDALFRTYVYSAYQSKNPFLQDSAYYFPYLVDADLLQAYATIIIGAHNFKSFAKKNIQSFTFNCHILESNWHFHQNEFLTYTVIGNRFLRGMVRGLAGTMLALARKKKPVSFFKEILERQDASRSDFSAPAHGLQLTRVSFTPTEK